MNFRKTLITTACAGALAALGSTGTAVAQTQFTAMSWYDPAHPHSRYGYTEWAEIVEEYSDGQLQPEVFIGTQLLSARNVLQGIRDGVVDVAHHAAIFTPSELPVANAVQELGFNYSDPLVAIMAVTEFSMTNEEQLEEWRDQNLVYLGSYSTPSYVLMCNQPVRNLDEIQGMRIRTAGSMISRWVEEVGGEPVNVPSDEMYTGLDRGTMDCASNAVNDLIDRSLWEVAEHTTMLPTGMYWSGPQWGYNRDFWQGLSAEDRSTLMEATALAMARMNINFIKEGESAMEEALEKGVNIYDPDDDLMEHVRNFRDQAEESAIEMARDEYGVNDPEGLIAEFQGLMDAWEDRLAAVDREDEDAVAELAMEHIYSDIDPETYGTQ